MNENQPTVDVNDPTTSQIPDPNAVVIQGPDGYNRTEGYHRLLSFIIGNARQGEVMAIQNYSEMVILFDTVEEQMEAIKQAREESKHIVLLDNLAKRLDVPLSGFLLQKEWTNIRANFHKAAQKGDLAACLIIQDLMVESLAIAMYQVFSSDENADPETKKVSANILRDELEHIEIGAARIKKLMDKDRDAVHDSLNWAHHKVMPDLFNMVHSACDFLCDKVALDCDITEMGNTTIDLESLKISALDNYVKMLDLAGFDSKVVNPIVASMSAYEGMASGAVGMNK